MRKMRVVLAHLERMATTRTHHKNSVLVDCTSEVPCMH